MCLLHKSGGKTEAPLTKDSSNMPNRLQTKASGYHLPHDNHTIDDIVDIVDIEAIYQKTQKITWADRLEQPSAASKGGDLGRRGWRCHSVEVG